MPKDSVELGQLLVVETLNRLDGKLDKLDDRLDKVDNTMIRQQSILDEHVRRTNLLETKMEADAKALKIELPAVIQEHIKTERNKLVLKVLKITGALAATGTGGVALKTAISFVLKIWSP